jgi:hypothetical protein
MKKKKRFHDRAEILIQDCEGMIKDLEKIVKKKEYKTDTENISKQIKNSKQ